ncbi:hypothetical protein NP493_180g07038 [Ridgeia piscesae]|uniref:guanylate cyclase n=1 Tax=Ridgeia piscesae TaxID=27915 RepID=A0AAD9P2Q6_RIDPI|nr:hypothetical protein NP493_180g07038 [Ridgeia piscesae]
MFWTAPEVLRCHFDELQLGKISSCDCCQSPAADIYSLGVVWKETFCRNNPYSEHDELSPTEIIQRVAKPNGSAVFRPPLNDLGVSTDEQQGAVRRQLARLIAACLAEDPSDRPTAYRALKDITKLNPFRKTNILDNMAAMMETYSNHLEEVVNERTHLIEEERKRTETILYRMLPNVTVYFSDVVRFTDLVVESTPIQVVEFLNSLYALFDDIIARHDVYKVETISDTYMLASGLPTRNHGEHIAAVADCALDILSAALTFTVPHIPNYQCAVRIALRIHLSSQAQTALSEFAGYHMADRGYIDVKGVLPDFTGLSAGDSPRPTPMPVTTGKRVYAKKAPISSVTGSSEFSPPDADNNPGSSRDITEVSV